MAVAMRSSVLSGGVHRLRSENLAFDIDVWYPPLAEYTFPSIFLPLQRQEAQALVAYYNVTRRHVSDPNHAILTLAHVHTLQALELRLDQVLQDDPMFAAVPTEKDGSDGTNHDKNTTAYPNRTRSGGGGAFVRLCGRSPKDGEPTDPERRAQIWQCYQDTLRRGIERYQSQDDDENGNTRAVAILQTTELLRVRSGPEAMALLLTSERVFSDMLDWLQYGEPEQIVLRAWNNTFDLTTEFRCFVEPGGVLVGISQYDPYVRLGYLQETAQQDAVIRTVLEAWKNVRDLIETIDQSYCVDFGVDLTRGTAQLIELSPFRSCTGPSLFAWNKAEKCTADDVDDLLQKQEQPKLVMPHRPDVCDRLISSAFTNNPDDDNLNDNRIAQAAILRIRAKVVHRIGELVHMNWDYQWSEEQRRDIPRPHQEVFAKVVAATTPVSTSEAFLCFFRGLFGTWLGEQKEEKHHVLFVYGTLKCNCHWHNKYLSEAHFLGDAMTAQPQSLVIGQCGVPYMILQDFDDNAVDERAKSVWGELWSVSTAMLQSIDEYEGTDKNHYTRQEITVIKVQHGDRSLLSNGVPSLSLSSSLGDGRSNPNVTTASTTTTTTMKAFCYFRAVHKKITKIPRDTKSAYHREEEEEDDEDSWLERADRISEYTVEEQRNRYKPIHHIQVKQLHYLGERATT